MNAIITHRAEQWRKAYEAANEAMRQWIDSLPRCKGTQPTYSEPEWIRVPADGPSPSEYVWVRNTYGGGHP